MESDENKVTSRCRMVMVEGGGWDVFLQATLCPCHWHQPTPEKRTSGPERDHPSGTGVCLARPRRPRHSAGCCAACSDTLSSNRASRLATSPPTMASAEQDAGMELDGLLAADDLETRNEPLAAAAGARAGVSEALDMLEARRLGRSLAIPTDDARVRQRLRALGEPITAFGERPPDRRERLREVLVHLAREQGEAGPRSDAGSDEAGDIEDEEEAEEQEEEFYTEGTSALVEARRDMAQFSLKNAARRIAIQRKQATIPLQRIVTTRRNVFAPLRTFTNMGSQIGDSRPISIVRFSPDGKMLGTGSWSGGVKLWEMPSAKAVKSLRGHTDKVGGLSWHPQATLTQPTSALNLATGAADGNVFLWNLESDRPMASLAGHQARVARVEFHPSGKYVASASFDGTWRLWDAEQGAELLVQEGHSKEVYTVAFQGDGALLASGGLDAVGRIWDLRTGRTAMILDGHAREVLSIDWSSNGYTLATASADDTVKIWDLRQLKQSYSIPAHKSNCADVRFFRSADERAGLSSGSGVVDDVDPDPEHTASKPVNGSSAGRGADAGVPLPRSSMFLATSGYDGYVKIWSADNWQIVRAMHADSKAMSVDISPGMFSTARTDAAACEPFLFAPLDETS